MARKSWQCKSCKEYVPKKIRVSKKYCSTICKEKDRTIICPNCSKSFLRINGRKYCSVCRQKNTYARLSYQKNLIEKQCKKCKISFPARSKQTLCNDCYQENRQTTFIHSYKSILQQVHCLKCNLPYRERKIKMCPATHNNFRQGYCQNCRTLNKSLRSKKKYFCRKCNNLLPSRRRTCDKCKEPKKYYCIHCNTLIPRNSSGKVYAKYCSTCRHFIQTGPRNSRWKGNRTFDQTCRSRLYASWTRPVLKRDKYQCTVCFSKKNLQVHHIYPMRYIIRETLQELNITDISSLSCLDNKEYDQAIEAIIHKHKLSYGITVCKQCHADIDDRYRRIPSKKGKTDEEGKN